MFNLKVTFLRYKSFAQSWIFGCSEKLVELEIVFTESANSYFNWKFKTCVVLSMRSFGFYIANFYKLSCMATFLKLIIAFMISFPSIFVVDMVVDSFALCVASVCYVVKILFVVNR